MVEAVLRLDAVRKRYGEGTPLEQEVLHGIDLQLARGEFAALIGPSGSGKSTLLNLIGLLEPVTSGQLTIQGHAVAGLDDAARTALRADTLGFVFQFHHLLSAFSAEENILLPEMASRGHITPEMRANARQLLQRVGLSGFEHKKANQLSGGQQQRVAIARALARRPALVLADEPTGNLDTRTADEIFSLLREFNQQEGMAFLIVTHDPRLAARCDRIIQLVDGQIVSDQPNTPIAPA